MRLRHVTFVGLLALLSSASACGFEEWLEPEKEDDGTPTPGGSPTPSTNPSPPPTPVTTTDGDVTTFDWGTQSLGAGTSPRFRFTAPADTIDIDFMAIGAAADEGKIFGFFNVIAPGNRTVIDNTADGPTRQAYALDAMSFAVPADDSATSAAAPGQWEFAVLAAGANGLVTSTPRVLAKARTAPGGTVPAGELDLNVIIVDGVGITAATACQSGTPLFNGLGYAAGLYASGSSGLTLVNVTCYDLPGSSAFTDINGQDELSALFETSASLADARLNLFIVDSFSGDLGFAAGVAGSVPIPMQLNGTRRSGVAVEYRTNATAFGEAVAHELGHSLGLYHTTEFNAATNGFDPISDTPQCPSLGGSYGGSGCPDDTNVMFPQITGSMQGFSAGQMKVLKPAVHVRRAGVSAFAPDAGFAPVKVTTAAITPVLPGSPDLPAWEGPALECREGVMRRRVAP